MTIINIYMHMKELFNIQNELVAPKDLHNKFGGYSYRSAEGILEALKPLLKENKCILLLSDEVVEMGGRFYIKATAHLMNSENMSVRATAYAREEESLKGQIAAQITGSASSYARKYALNGLFCIDDNKDPDATNRHDVKDGDESPEPETAKKPATKTAEKVPTKRATKAKEAKTTETKEAKPTAKTSKQTKAETENEINLKAAVKALSECETVKDVNNLLQKSKNLWTSTAFKAAVKKRREELE